MDRIVVSFNSPIFFLNYRAAHTCPYLGKATSQSGLRDANDATMRSVNTGRTGDRQIAACRGSYSSQPASKPETNQKFSRLKDMQTEE